MNIPLTYRKHVVTQNDLFFIVKVIDEYRREGRSAISHRLCEVWDWRQDNGQLKDGVCRGLLLQLEPNQLTTLPPTIIDNNNRIFGDKLLSNNPNLVAEIGGCPIIGTSSRAKCFALLAHY